MDDAWGRDGQGEAAVRRAVRLDVGEAMTRLALRIAMRDQTPDSYRQSVLKDGASAIALAATDALGAGRAS